MDNTHYRSRFNSGLSIARACVAGILLPLSGAGCASHRETAQQQFTDALMRGNAAQASYIWNSMSGPDRAAFTSGEGIKPQVDRDAVAAQIVQHQAEEDGQDSSADPPATMDIPGE